MSDRLRFGPIRWMPLFSCQKESLLVPFSQSCRNEKKEYSTDLRSLVIQHFLNGDSYAVIAKEVLIPHQAI